MAEEKSKKSNTVEQVKPEDKGKALAAALAQIEKQFGKGSIMKMDGSHKDETLEVISTGSLGLDLALGVGGLPRGRIVEIFGPESSGKTTLCLETIAQCQKNGGTCAFIDAENAFDPVYARALGVKVEELMVSQPDTGEQGQRVGQGETFPAEHDQTIEDEETRQTNGQQGRHEHKETQSHQWGRETEDRQHLDAEQQGDGDPPGIGQSPWFLADTPPCRPPHDE